MCARDSRFLQTVPGPADDEDEDEDDDDSRGDDDGNIEPDDDEGYGDEDDEDDDEEPWQVHAAARVARSVALTSAARRVCLVVRGVPRARLIVHGV